SHTHPKAHTTRASLFVQVYDVTSYLHQHPGGDAILRNAGEDSTEGMHGPQHPPSAMEILQTLYIGLLEA
ncbi:unnamed protein product, partial [Ectocarpus sp. 12 AP-2014]